MKAAVREILDEERYEEFEIPSYALSDEELWTYQMVKMALVDAFRMLRRTAGNVGPTGLAAFWSDYYEPGVDYPADSTKTSPYGTLMTVTRMEQVLIGWRDEDGNDQPAWLNGPLMTVPEYRHKLICWIFAELNGTSSNTLCHQKKWAPATFKYRRDRAAYLIADRLNRLGVKIWSTPNDVERAAPLREIEADLLSALRGKHLTVRAQRKYEAKLHQVRRQIGRLAEPVK